MPIVSHMASSKAPLAVVTGASSGMGRELAKLLAQRGFRTLLIARRSNLIEALANELSAHSPSMALPMDLAEGNAIEPALAPVIREIGPADVLINNAGCGLYRPFLDCSRDDHRRLMEVHYFAAIAMLRATLPGMVKQRRGHVINIASMATKVGPWGHSSYAAAKAALVSLTESLAAEHGPDCVHFSYVNPGFVQTEFFDEPSLAPVVSQNGRRALSTAYAAAKIIGLLDRPRLELCLPAHYRILEWIKALSPALALHLVASHSRPPKMAASRGNGVKIGSPAPDHKGG